MSVCQSLTTVSIGIEGKFRHSLFIGVFVNWGLLLWRKQERESLFNEKINQIVVHQIYENEIWLPRVISLFIYCIFLICLTYTAIQVIAAFLFGLPDFFASVANHW